MSNFSNFATPDSYLELSHEEKLADLWLGKDREKLAEAHGKEVIELYEEYIIPLQTKIVELGRAVYNNKALAGGGVMVATKLSYIANYVLFQLGYHPEEILRNTEEQLHLIVDQEMAHDPVGTLIRIMSRQIEQEEWGRDEEVEKGEEDGQEEE